MNWFLKHVPDCVEGAERPRRTPFNTTADLLNIEPVAWNAAQPGFSHFAVTDRHLMAIFKGGAEWYVVGDVDDTNATDLPRWEPPARRAGC